MEDPLSSSFRPPSSSTLNSRPAVALSRNFLEVRSTGELSAQLGKIHCRSARDLRLSRYVTCYTSEDFADRFLKMLCARRLWCESCLLDGPQIVVHMASQTRLCRFNPQDLDIQRQRWALVWVFSPNLACESSYTAWRPLITAAGLVFACQCGSVRAIRSRSSVVFKIRLWQCSTYKSESELYPSSFASHIATGNLPFLPIDKHFCS